MIRRRTVQLVSLFALHASWGPELKWFCNPVLTCHSCALSWFACPIGVLVHFSGYHIFPWVALGTMLLFGALIGRMLCGWMCPFGLLMDLLHKIPSPKFELPRWTAYTKYLVLGLMVFLLPFLLGESTMWSFCRFCPASAIEVTIPGLVQGGVGSIDGWLVAKLAVLLAVVVLAVMSRRSFCKTLCPIAALLGPLNHFSFWAMKSPTPQPCPGCGKCDRACPTHIEPSIRLRQGLSANRHENCIVCHDCQNACPSHAPSKTTKAAPADL